jgi:microtubule-associated protein-like 6
MADKSLLARTDLEQKIRSVSFNADGSHLGVGLGDGSFCVLKARSGLNNNYIHET